MQEAGSNTKEEDEDTIKLTHSLELMVILATILIPVLLALANISINVEATSYLASNNSFGANSLCSTQHNISSYYKCENGIIQHAYMAQYAVMDKYIIISILLVSSIILLLAVSQHIEKNKRIRRIILAIAGVLLIILLNLLVNAIGLYSGTFIKSTIFSWSSIIIIYLFLSYIMLVSLHNLKNLEPRKIKRLVIETSKEKFFAKLNQVKLKAGLGIILLFIGLLFTYFSISASENFFNLATKNIIEYYWLAINIISILFGALFIALGIVLIGRKFEFTPIKDLERQILDRFTYLPIYCTDNFNINIEAISKEIDNPKLVTWHSEDALKATLKADINRMPNKEKVSEIIDQFSDEFDKITIELYKNYKIAYEKLGNLTENNKILMLGLYNKLLGCDRVYWPNIYNTIQENPDLSKRCDLLAKQLNDITELQNYKRLVKEAHEMKDRYKEKLENIVS